MTPGIPEVKQKPVKEKKVKKEKTKAKPKRKPLVTESLQRYLRVRCPICLLNLGKDSAVVSTRCGHVFCRNCLQKALLVKPACPTCRKKLTGAQAYRTLYLDDDNVDDDNITIGQ